MTQLLQFVVLALVAVPWANAFPSYRSLSGLSQDQLDEIIPGLTVAPPVPVPGPPADTSAKLVFDEKHPYIAPGPNDQRGPCPALNTLANHGYLPRNGIVTPGGVINAVQDGFNMANGAAGLLAYASLLAFGNPLTNLISLGARSPLTNIVPGYDVPLGGFDSHSVLEGDASLTRADAYFGDNHSFNQTLFNKLVDFSNRYGAGKYNLTVAAELRYQRILDGIAENPEFTLTEIRYNTAYFSSIFPLLFFVDGRISPDTQHLDAQVDLDVALGFFRDGKFPDGFWRTGAPQNPSVGAGLLLAAHPVSPGRNMGKVNTYTVDPNSATLTTPCLLASNFVNNVVAKLYPEPKGVLREALNRNIGYMYQFLPPSLNCTLSYPFGK